MFPLLPYQKLVFESPLSREEIIERLTRKVIKRRQEWFEQSTIPFEGTVSDTGFQISRIINYHNSFLPVINGCFFSHMEGVRIEVTMRLRTNMLIFCIVWFSFIGFAIINGTFFSPGGSPPTLIEVLPTCLFYLFFYFLFALGFWFEAKKAKNLLSEIFEAEDNLERNSNSLTSIPLLNLVQPFLWRMLKSLKHLLANIGEILGLLQPIFFLIGLFVVLLGFIMRALFERSSQIEMLLGSNPITANLVRIYFEFSSNRLILRLLLIALAVPVVWLVLKRPKHFLTNTLEILGGFQEMSENALKCYNKAIEINPTIKKQSLWTNRGVALFNLKQYEEAIYSFDKALEIERFYLDRTLASSVKVHQIWIFRGQALAMLKRYDEAIAAFDRALKLQPKFAQALLLRGITLFQAKEYNETVQTCDKLLKLQPKNVQVLLLKANSLIKLKQYDEALLTYEQALKLQPYNADIWNDRAVLMCRCQRYEEALFCYKRALKFNHNHWLAKYEQTFISIEAKLNDFPWMSKINQKIERYFPNLIRCAEDFFAFDSEKLKVKFNPNYRLAKSGLGFVLIELNRLDEALKLSQQLERQFPNEPLPLNVKGYTLSRMGRAAEAIATYEQAIQLQPDYANSWYNKACHYAENGEVAEAIFNLQRALELNPDFVDPLATDKSFDCLRDREEFQQLLKN